MSWFNPLSWFVPASKVEALVLKLIEEEKNKLLNQITYLQGLVSEAQDAFKCADANNRALNLSLSLVEDHYTKEIDVLGPALMAAVILNGGPITISKEIMEISNNPEDDSTVNTKVNDDGSMVIFIAEGDVDEYDEFDEKNFDEEFDYEDDESPELEKLETVDG